MSIERWLSNLSDRFGLRQKQFSETERKQVIHNILVGKYKNEEEVKEDLGRYNLFQNHTQYCIVLFIIGNYDKFNNYNKYEQVCNNFTSNDLFIIKDEISNVFNKLLGNGAECEALINLNNEVVIAINGDFSSQASKEQLIKSCIETSDHIKQAYKIEISCGIGSVTDDLMKLEESYSHGKIASEYGFYKSNGIVISYDNIQNQLNNRINYSDDKIEKIIGYMKQSSGDKAELELNRFILDLENTNINDAKAYIISLAISICRYLETLNITGDFDYFTAIHNINTTDALDKSAVSIRELIRMGIEDINIKKYQRTENLIDEIQNYIEENYSNPKFSINDLEYHVNYSGNHIRNIFRAAYGCTPTEYLVNFRINKAKYILENTDLTAAEVAEKVGYLNPKYFYSLFKKHTGMTTYEYRVNSHKSNID